MKRIVTSLGLAGLALAILSFFAAPLVAFMGIRSAAQARDIAGLQALVDYDAVRASLRPQLAVRPVPQTPAPSFWKDPYGAVMRQMDPAVLVAPRVVNPDLYLQPEALEALMRGEGRAALRAGVVARSEAQSSPFARPVYWGLNRARLAVPGARDSRTIFTFERRGAYEWKLVHIGLPPSENQQPTRAASTTASPRG